MDKYIATAAIIMICLAILPSAVVPQQIMKCPETANEPIGQSEIPTPTPPKGHVPVAIHMGNSSDLSFIYEGVKPAYVQFYSKDYDRVIRITYQEYMRLADMGKITSYGTFAPGDHGQTVHEAGHRNGMQGKASGLNKYVASVREIANTLRDYTQGMINTVRTGVLPAVDGKIVTPLRDYTQGMINKVRIAVK